MRSASRIERWTGIDPGGAFDAKAQADAMDARSEQALRTALAALEAAGSRLERADRRRRVLAAVEAVVGLTGLGCLLAPLSAAAPQADIRVVGLFASVAAVPMCLSLLRAAISGRHEREEIAAVETARTVSVHAASLVRALEVATRPTQSEPVAIAVADEVLAHIEQTTAALEGRERRLDVGHGSTARRHVRIKPINDRIAITKEDGTTVIAQLVDVSISGAMIAGYLADLRSGDRINVGSRAANVVRTLDRGFACEFVEPLPAQSLAPNMVL